METEHSTPTADQIKPWMVFVTLMVFCLVYLVNQAANKLFWHDEIFSLSVASIPLGWGTWEAMTAGYELHPPLTYIAIWSSESLLGRGPVTTRLPFIMAGLISCWGLYRFTSRSEKAWTGLWAVLLFLQTGAIAYFIDARGYAFMLAGAALFLVGWQERARLGHMGAKPLFLVALGILLATAGHMWSVGLLLAIGIAELVRWIGERRVDLPMFLAMMAGASPLVFYPVLVAACSNLVFDEGTYRHSILMAYHKTFGGALVLAGVVLLPILVHRLVRNQRVESHNPKTSTSELVLVVLLLLNPAIIYVIASLSGTPYIERYGILASLALAYAGACAIEMIVSEDRMYRTYATVALIVGLMWSFREPMWTVDSYDAEWLTDELISTDRDSLIIIGSGYHFIPIHYHASKEIKSRLRKVVDKEKAILWLGTDGEDTTTINGAKYLNIEENLLSYEEFSALEKPFWFVDYPNWVQSTELMKRAQVRASDESEILYRVQLVRSN